MKGFLFGLAVVAGLLLAANSTDAGFRRSRSVVKVKTVGVGHVAVVGVGHSYGFGSGFYGHSNAFLLPRTVSYGVVGLGMGYGGCSNPAPAPAPAPAPVPPPQPLPPAAQAPVADPCPTVAAPIMSYAAPVALAQSYVPTVRRVAFVNHYVPTVGVRRVRVVHSGFVAAPVAVVKQKTVVRNRGGFRRVSRVRTKTVTRVR